VQIALQPNVDPGTRKIIGDLSAFVLTGERKGNHG